MSDNTQHDKQFNAPAAYVPLSPRPKAGAHSTAPLSLSLSLTRCVTHDDGCCAPRSYRDAQAAGTLDWWGINYYSRPAINWRLQLCGWPGCDDLLSDTGMRIDPAGLYEAVQEAAALRVPMFVTETGLADAAGLHRALFIQSHLAEVLRAVADGYDLRGIYYWTLSDNIEW